MNWTTIYITGRPGFQAEVRKKLANSNLDFMRGYVDNTTATVTHDLYWLKDVSQLRAMKEAVGSKIIWKYRLQFYASLETFLQLQNKAAKTVMLTQEDLNLMAHMRKMA